MASVPDHLLPSIPDHLGFYFCKMCGRHYKNKNSWSFHEKYECGKEASHQCLLCPYKTKRKRDLDRHNNKMHLFRTQTTTY